MTLNQIVSVDGGKYLLLADAGYDGIRIVGQPDSLHAIVEGISECYGNRFAVVKLIEVCINEETET